jgi:hypothetical protein
MDNKLFNNWESHNHIAGSEKDKFGNAKGSEYDLAKDKAFTGLKIAVLHLYTSEGFDFKLPQKALERKGFGLIYWKDKLPSLKDFKYGLKAASQLWIISADKSHITEEYLKEIILFYQEGKGLYLWGDNDPYYADVNLVSKRLWNIQLSGNDFGNQVLGIQKGPLMPGLKSSHQISTGIENIYEGITISYIEKAPDNLTPLIYSSKKKIVAAFYDRNGERAIIDGGFTRLYTNWDSAGTERYVVNAAAWLTNHERTETQQIVKASPAKVIPGSQSIINKF